MNEMDRQNCRSCKEKLVRVISLGDVPVMNMGNKTQEKAPLDLGYCPKCTLLQLMHTVNPEFLFREYYYKSGVSNTIRADLESIVKGAMERVKLSPEDMVLDIGANDGTLLKNYPDWLFRCGFEPAKNLTAEALDGLKGGGINPNFFTFEKAKEIVPKVKIVTAISMFYDLDDPHDFLNGVKHILADDGVFVIQQNYLPAMLRNNAFDNIVHEHLEYYSVRSLTALLLQHGLMIEDVEFNEINGGSFRTYIRHNTEVYPPKESVSRALEQENKLGLDNVNTYVEFAKKVEVVSWKLYTLLERLYKENKLVYIAGASTRGNTLINVAQIGGFIKFAVERNPAKHGQTYNGIPVVSEKFAEEFPPDYYLILPWHFSEEMFGRIRRSGQMFNFGTKLIFPLPEPYIVEAHRA